MKFSERLRFWRSFRDLTQEQLAHACHFSGQSRIANYESEKNSREPNLDELRILAEALEVPVDALISDDAFQRVRELLEGGYPISPAQPLSVREIRLLDNFRSAEETGKAAIETTASALAKRESKTKT